MLKNLPSNAGNVGLIPGILGSGRCPAKGNCSPLQYFCLGNPVDSGVEPGVLQSMGSQRLGCDFATKQQQEAALTSWLMAFSCHYLLSSSPSQSLTWKYPSYKDSSEYIGPTKSLNLVTSAKSPFPCKVTHSQELGCHHLLEGRELFSLIIQISEEGKWCLLSICHVPRTLYIVHYLIKHSQQPFKVGTIIPTTDEKMILIEFQELAHHLVIKRSELWKDIEEFQVNITTWEELVWKCCMISSIWRSGKDKIMETIKRSVVAWS